MWQCATLRKSPPDVQYPSLFLIGGSISAGVESLEKIKNAWNTQATTTANEGQPGLDLKRIFGHTSFIIAETDTHCYNTKTWPHHWHESIATCTRHHLAILWAKHSPLRNLRRLNLPAAKASGCLPSNKNQLETVRKRMTNQLDNSWRLSVDLKATALVARRSRPVPLGESLVPGRWQCPAAKRLNLKGSQKKTSGLPILPGLMPESLETIG